MSDFLINERKVHVETIQALFYRLNSLENVFWKARVYSLDLDYYTKLKIQGRMLIELKRTMKWELYSKEHSSKFFQSFSNQGLSIITSTPGGHGKQSFAGFLTGAKDCLPPGVEVI